MFSLAGKKVTKERASRSRLLILSIGFVLVASPLLAAGSRTTPARAAPAVRRPIPSVEAFPPNERGRLMIIHFWATWCAPCRREIRSLEAFYNGPYRRLHEQGLVLLSVDNDVRMKDLRSFLDRNQVSFPIYFDSLRDLNERFDLVGLPATVLLDHEGRVVSRVIGPQDWQSAAFLARIEAHLQQQTNARGSTGGTDQEGT